jgi:hypothetical protein
MSFSETVICMYYPHLLYIICRVCNKYICGIIYVLIYFSLRYDFNVCDGGLNSTVSDRVRMHYIFSLRVVSLLYSRFNAMALVCVSLIFLNTWP